MENLIILEIENTADYPEYFFEEDNKRWVFRTDDSDNSFVYIFAVIEKRIVGHAHFCQNDINGQKWYYSRLGVADNYLRRGIAQKMAETGIGNLRKKGVKKICCDIHPNNIASTNLHNKLSFQINQ